MELESCDAARMDIKICGLKTEDAIAAALDGGASHIGFIFFPKSPRNVSPDEAGRLRRAARGKALAVAVTVDADDAFLDDIVAAMQPDILQLHGAETPARVVEVKARYGLPVIKALSVSSAEDLDKVRPFTGVADRFLFDAKPPNGSDLPGGNGVSFDWNILGDLDPEIDYLLSGGINAGNVGVAIKLAHPPGIDLSSGVETAPGVKSVELIRDLIASARASSG